MSKKKNLIKLNIETLVLVAVWENPYIFQGCIKIAELQKDYTVLYYFRSQSNHKNQNEILDNDFSPNDYEFTHLYNESGLIPLDTVDATKEHALYMMKYSLHVTLKEMISSKKQHFTLIDDIAMQAMINKIKPILNKELDVPEDEHIGFAVAMDFCPKEELGRSAAIRLLNKLENQEIYH